MVEAHTKTNQRRPRARARGQRGKGAVRTDEALQLCTAYLYRKDGCERNERCNNLHICRHYILQSCRRARSGSCVFSHDLQSGQPQALLQRNYGIPRLEGKALQDFKVVFAATINPPKDAEVGEYESDETREEKIRLNKENLMTFLNTFTDTTSQQPQLPTNCPPRSRQPEICFYYLHGHCKFQGKYHGSYCHLESHFQWQVQDAERRNVWQNLTRQTNNDVEKCFCTVGSQKYTGKILVCDEICNNPFIEMTITFGTDHNIMTAKDEEDQPINVRRLSTSSHVLWGGWRNHYSTKWTWNWMDDSIKWKEYPKRVNLMIEKEYQNFQNRRGSSLYNFTMDRGQFRISFSDMTQTFFHDDEDGRIEEVMRRPKFTKQTKCFSDGRRNSCASSKSSTSLTSSCKTPQLPASQKSPDIVDIQDVTKQNTQEIQTKEPGIQTAQSMDGQNQASRSVTPKVSYTKNQTESLHPKIADNISNKLSQPSKPKERRSKEVSAAKLQQEQKEPKDLCKEPEGSVIQLKNQNDVRPKIYAVCVVHPHQEKLKLEVNSNEECQLSLVPTKKPVVSPAGEETNVPHPTHENLSAVLAKLKFTEGEEILDDMISSRQEQVDLLDQLKNPDIFKSPERVSALLTTLHDKIRRDSLHEASVGLSKKQDVVRRKEIPLDPQQHIVDIPKPNRQTLLLEGQEVKDVQQQVSHQATMSSSLPKHPSNQVSHIISQPGHNLQEDSIFMICTKHFRLKCKYEGNPHSLRHSEKHCYASYQWQIKKKSDWQDLPEADNDEVEKAFCDVDRKVFHSNRFQHDVNNNLISSVVFDKRTMKALQGGLVFTARRQSTASSVTKSNWETAFCTEWIWYWLDETNKWIVYSQQGIKGTKADIDSGTIEQKFLNYEQKFGPSEFDFIAGGQKYKLDFEAMHQTNVHRSTEKEVRRRPKFVSMEERTRLSKQISRSQKASVVVPTTWDSPGTKMNMKLVTIRDYSSAEYTNIANLFWDTMEDKATIVSIQRIQNLDLWEDFSRMSERMKKRNKGKPVQQKQLFYGTQEKYVNFICCQNFDWRLNRASVGTQYEKGSYFASNASYANDYTKADASDQRFVFVANVLVGETITGESSDLRPPSRDLQCLLEDLYDSCVNDVSNPAIFVIFEKMQVYPEYLITYNLKSTLGRTISSASTYPTSQSRATSAGQTITVPLFMGSTASTYPTSQSGATSAGRTITVPPFGGSTASTYPTPQSRATSAGQTITVPPFLGSTASTYPTSQSRATSAWQTITVPPFRGSTASTYPTSQSGATSTGQTITIPPLGGSTVAASSNLTRPPAPQRPSINPSKSKGKCTIQ